MQEQELAEKIDESDSGNPVETTLTTNERVLARITDGIYRQPASALRELISNAYDADAREVAILTDAPRFSSIVVRDDGFGLSPATLAHLIKNIGGSAKRTQEGVKLEVTSSDPSRSPGGRRLIGKLGIGMFAVSQFTRHFMIISKRKGDKFRTVADITLGPVNNEQRLLTYDRSGDPEIETGKALIYRERALGQDVSSQGTEIRLLDLLPRTRAELASDDLWARIDFEMETEGKATTLEPLLHIGRVSKAKRSELTRKPALPWDDEDSPEQKFGKFVQRVRSYALTDKELVDLERVCDRYLQTIWTLALSAPLPYLDGHPFDLTGRDDLLFYQVENATRGQSKTLKLKATESPRSSLGLKSPEVRKGDRFRISFDGVELLRPIVFRDQAKSSSAVKTPLLFVGHCRETFKGKPIELSGGALDFEAYLFWTPKVVPTQHQGVVIRVGNASGVLFDRTFMGYQISEQTRLRQITAEIFIREGFDGAINLDRESYNFSHPHYQFLVKWLHSALRQLTNRHKEVGKEVRTGNLIEEGKAKREALDAKVAELLEARGVEDVPEVVLLGPDEASRAPSVRREGKIALNREAVIPPSSAQRKTGADVERRSMVEKKVVAVAQLLEAWGVLKSLSHREQEQLVREIIEVVLFGSE
ncbi:MAG: ATP-binding protein [Planctomycetota bacterium]|nr:ATP-binding protein [Planctomycetota bacterium]